MKILFLKVHIHFDLPQQSGDLDTVEGVSRKPADGFDDDHIHLTALALSDQLVELVTLFHAGAGDAFVGINACQLPAGFPTDALGVVVHLILIAVKLFILLGG